MKTFFITLIFGVSVFASCKSDDEPAANADNNLPAADTSSQIVDNGKISNPLVMADIPDVSPIRVGNDFYTVSTSMHLVPGAPILHSTDLKNWHTESYVIESLTGTPAANLEYDANINRSEIYSQGSWASSLAYHDGKYYCLWNKTGFGTGSHSYISVADKAEGPWTILHEIDYFYDASLFFDDDDKAYIIAAHGEYITLLNSDLSPSKTVYYFSTDPYTGEGYQMKKINGKYYIFMMCWPSGSVRSVVCLRSNKIEGPYESKMVLSSKIGGSIGDGVSQGSIIDMPDGSYYGLFFTDMGSVGRCPVLVSCKFVDGWPVLGTDGVAESELNAPFPLISDNNHIVDTDNFSDSALDLMWQFNHNPDNDNWSLTQREGYLRLTTGHVATDFFHARNTLTCRTMGTICTGIVSVDVSNMKNGDFAGFAMMQYRSGQIGVMMKDSKKYIFCSEGLQDGETAITQGEEILDNIVSFKITADFNANTATFYYGMNGALLMQQTHVITMTYDLKNFTGNRFALFNYSTLETGGSVDFDYFKFKQVK